MKVRPSGVGVITLLMNKALRKHAEHGSMKVSTVRWMSKGNLPVVVYVVR